METPPLSEYLALRSRPPGRAVMNQRWRSLTFLHFALNPTELQPLLPPSLTVDTYPDDKGDEKAWVGLVPFRMEGVTPRGVPEIPGIHAFPETNVRTYVHRDGKEPGVWFFSLDAANALACRVARHFFHLPYHEAAMTVTETSNVVQYKSVRRSSGDVCNLESHPGEALATPEPGSLEFFLVERYLLYAFHQGQTYTGRVFHKPYSVQRAEVHHLNETLTQAAGIEAAPFQHILFSPGVDVEVFPLVKS